MDNTRLEREANKAVDEIQSTVGTLIQEIEEKETEIEQLKSKIKSLEETIEELQNQIDDLKNE